MQVQKPNNSLPQAILALGKIVVGGHKQVLSERIIARDNFYVLDASMCFMPAAIEASDDEQKMQWVRVPGFLHLLKDNCPQAKFFYQLNHFSQSNPQLHSLYDPVSKQLIPLCHFEISNSTQDNKNEEISLDTFSTIETYLLYKEYLKAENEIMPLVEQDHIHPRLCYDLGLLHFALGDYPQAKVAFHQAQLLGHPDALDAEWKTASYEGKSFRDKHAEIFAYIQRGESLRALCHLRSLLDEEPLHASATLAYCLRHANEPAEGLEVCYKALAQDPLQSDVYGHLWSYLFQLRKDQEALQVAQTHLADYPLNPQAYTDALDAALLLGELELAKYYAHGYLINAINLNTALKNLFKYYDQVRDWHNLKCFYETIIPILRAPTPNTLTQYGETLIELNEFSLAQKTLESAMMAAPENASVILANARCLAKSGDLDTAIKFMHTIIHDTNRNDHIADKFLMIAFLSELYRNSGLLDNALALWPNTDELNQALLDQIGPRPFVEYAYCLAENYQYVEARKLLTLVQNDFKDFYIVQELEEKLTELDRI